MNNNQNLYILPLNAYVKIGVWKIWRVPSGWIYYNKAMGTVFVPFDNYFQ